MEPLIAVKYPGGGVGKALARLNHVHEELNSALYKAPLERPRIKSPDDVVPILRCFIGNLDHEELWVITMDSRNCVMQLIQLYKGSVNSSQVRISEVFRQAVIDNSPCIIVVHNHPSGDTTPSMEDISLTKMVVAAGKLLDTEVLDHLIISTEGFTSLKSRGLGFT